MQALVAPALWPSHSPGTASLSLSASSGPELCSRLLFRNTLKLRQSRGSAARTEELAAWWLFVWC